MLRATSRTNERKTASRVSLDLTLTQHLRDEKPEPREVRACLEVKPPQA
jgi:hypothetical protein